MNRIHINRIAIIPADGVRRTESADIIVTGGPAGIAAARRELQRKEKARILFAYTEEPEESAEP